VTVGTHRSEFTYDGLSRRTRSVEKENGATVRDAQLFWAGTELIEERTSTADVNRFYGDGEQHDGVARYLTREHLGSIREVTDANGTVMTRNEYDPYGRLTRVAGTADSRFGFTGHYIHGQSGLLLALYRAYDPALGRWLSEDPGGGIDGPNLHAYVGNRPIAWRDGDGRFGILIVLIPPIVEALATATVSTIGTFAAVAAGEKLSDVLMSSSEAEDSGKQDNRLTPGEIKNMKDKGIDPEELKGGRKTGGLDLFKKPGGEIVIKPKDGSGPGEPTGYNAKDVCK
jgi:RHS repeat-associated protein